MPHGKERKPKWKVGRKRVGRKEVDRSTDPRTERKTERQMRLSTHLSMTAASGKSPPPFPNKTSLVVRSVATTFVATASRGPKVATPGSNLTG